MNNFNDIYPIIKELVLIYGSTTVSSLLFNKIYFRDINKKAYNKSKRKLKYRDLSLESCFMLNNVKEVFKLSNKISLLLSIIPGYQIVYTIGNIIGDKNRFSYYFDEKITEINKKELLIRKKFLEQIKLASKIPNDIKEKLKDESYLPNEEEFTKVMLYNRPKAIVNKKNIKIIRRTPETEE